MQNPYQAEPIWRTVSVSYEIPPEEFEKAISGQNVTPISPPKVTVEMPYKQNIPELVSTPNKKSTMQQFTWSQKDQYQQQLYQQDQEKKQENPQFIDKAYFNHIIDNQYQQQESEQFVQDNYEQNAEPFYKKTTGQNVYQDQYQDDFGDNDLKQPFGGFNLKDF